MDNNRRSEKRETLICRLDKFTDRYTAKIDISNYYSKIQGVDFVNGKMKRKSFIMALIAIGLILIVVLPFMHGTVIYKHLATFVSPNGINRIEIRYKDAFLFGSHEIRIVARENSFFSFSTVYYDTKLFNDGGKLFVDNAQVKWVSDNFATITLFGFEQIPENIEVSFDSEIAIIPIIAENMANCYGLFNKKRN